MLKFWRFALPLLIFIILVGFFWKGLSLNPREVPSPLVGKAAPQFSLPQLHQPDKNFSLADMRGKVWLLNVWGSWCASCRIEHPLLVELAKQNTVPIIGLNWRDSRDDALGWLQRFGNPYLLSVSDSEGRVAIDFGVYGAPETFVIDKTGTIRYKQIGPLSPEILRDVILPLVNDLNRA